MTIEKSPSAVAPNKAATRADSQGSKAKPADDAPQGGGFMAILGALDDAPAAVAPTTDAALPYASTAQSAVLDATALLQQNPQIAAAQAQLAAVTATAGAATQASTVSAAQPELPTETSQASAAAKRPAAPALPVAADPAKASALAADAVATGESATKGLQHAAGHAKPGKDPLVVAADTSQTNSGAAATASEKAEAVKWMAALEQAKAPPTAKVMEPAFAPLMVKAEKTTSERAASAFKSSEPGFSGTALGVSAPDYSQPGSAAPITAPEMQVAEQVTYWVSQNVQNAELKLDGLGLSPVEVSISVQGKEAQISFRTDEAATRDVLEGAGAHLKDLLQREGMTLTGVSVGTSGSGDSSGAERRARQAARQGAIAPLQVASVTAQDVNRRVGSGAGRSVDLFV